MLLFSMAPCGRRASESSLGRVKEREGRGDRGLGREREREEHRQQRDTDLHGKSVKNAIAHLSFDYPGSSQPAVLLEGKAVTLGAAKGIDIRSQLRLSSNAAIISRFSSFL